MKKNLKDITMLWHKTYLGKVSDIQKAQAIFTSIMLELYEDYFRSI